uniref:Cytochrome c oxidase subunit 7B n=1 Tax=Oncorhynchus kisutch TaxID=8019 RepID=A0A8C7J785_ONCKI
MRMSVECFLNSFRYLSPTFFHFVLQGYLQTSSRANMFRFVKAALNVSAGQGARQVRLSSTHSPEFHAKYGTGLMIGGFAFCVSVWGFVRFNIFVHISCKTPCGIEQYIHLYSLVCIIPSPKAMHQHQMYL